jgi:ElaB/YqjD/DUF883 family membrane-anchored ribosome-binding protein
MPNAKSAKLATPPGLRSGVLFFAVVAVGAAYIVFSKLNYFPATYVTLIPVLIMIAYALLLGLARTFRLRDDQSGDNLYYMGFLFTLTSLAVSLYQFSEQGSAEQIVQNFGIAIASTIAGIALRIFFNQMRRDPLEVEQTARLELADASRKVKRELESTVLEFAYFRRTMQQSLGEAIDEIGTQLKDAMERTVDRLDEFAATSSEPLEEASKKSGDTIQHLNARISEALEDAVKHIGDEVGKFSRSTAVMINSIDSIVSKLAALQTPDQIIEIKLNPMIQGLSRAVNNFGKHAETQAKAIDENLKQTQELTGALRAILANAMAKAESTGDNPGTDLPSASPSPVARNLPGSLSNTELRTSE